MEVKIEKLIYGGDGLARLPADERGRGKAVFVPFVLEGEAVEASLVEEKPGFARGRTERILQASAYRTEPLCPYFLRCGGCHYQHTAHEHQLEIKAAILKENLRRIAKLELPCDLQAHAASPWNYRNRTRMRVQTAPEFAIGYFRFGSHDLLPVEECPISSPLINRALAAVWDLGRKGKIESWVREIEFFANSDDSEMLVEVYVEDQREKRIPRLARNDKRGKHPNRPAETSAEEWESSAFKPIAESLRAAIPGATGVAVFPVSSASAEGKPAPAALAVAGDSHLTYRTAHGNYRVSAGAFFQVNRLLIDDLLTIATQGKSGKTALDLYAGVGLFSSVLSREFERVIAVESSPHSSADLAYNAPGNVKAVRATVEEFLTKSRVNADLVVADPPRNGLGERVSRAIANSRIPAVTYVSCDPATLARDLVVLLAAGYRVDEAHLVDLFPQTFHLETVLRLTR